MPARRGLTRILLAPVTGIASIFGRKRSTGDTTAVDGRDADGGGGALLPTTTAGRVSAAAGAGAVGAAAGTAVTGGASTVGTAAGKAGVAAAGALGVSGAAKTSALLGGGAAAGSAGTAGTAFTAGTAGTAGAATTAAGAGGAAAAGAGAAAAGAGTGGAAAAGAAGAAGAGGSAGATGGSGALTGPAAIGAVGVTAVAATVAVVALTGDPPPVEEPAAPTTTVAVEAPPVNAPVGYSVESEQTLQDNLLGSVNAGRTNPVTIAAIDGEPSRVGEPVTLPSGATVTVAADGTFAYDPGDGFVALPQGATTTDRFVYTVTDETGWSEEWPAEITVVGVNDEPELDEAPPSAIVDENGSTTLVVTATDPDDGDTLTFTLESPPPFVSLADGGDGTATITVSPGSNDAGTYDFGLTVADSATPPATAETTLSVAVREVRPPIQRVTDQLAVLYDFEEGSGAAVGDSSSGQPIDLTVADPDAVTWTPDGLRVNAPTTITSNANTSSLVASITGSNALTMEAWITPAVATQAGPARILSISSGVTSRNATLGHGLDDGAPADVWTGRIRSTTSSDNGRPGLSTQAGTATDRLTHVVFTRSAAGDVKLYVNGQLAASGTVDGDLSNWDTDLQLLLANETTGNRAWLGTYHLVAVFGKALSAAEVGQNYSVGP